MPIIDSCTDAPHNIVGINVMLKQTTGYGQSIRFVFQEHAKGEQSQWESILSRIRFILRVLICKYKIGARLILVCSTFSTEKSYSLLHNHFHFIKTQSLCTFRALLAHPQQALHEHSFGGCSLL
jgi:hypothetical protein